MNEQVSRAEWTEIANAVVIAIAGLLIAFATYQMSLWTGEEDLGFSGAGVLQTQAAQMSAAADARRTIGVQLLAQWFDARARGDAQVAGAYKARFPPGLHEAFDTWLAEKPFENPRAPSSPFEMPQYVHSETAQVSALQQQADDSFKRARRAKQTADAYSQVVTILSLALFFAGINQVFKFRQVRMALLALAAIACMLGVVRIASLPIMALHGT